MALTRQVAAKRRYTMLFMTSPDKLASTITSKLCWTIGVRPGVVHTYAATKLDDASCPNRMGLAGPKPECLRHFARGLDLEWHASSNTWWNPGATIRITIHEKAKP